VRTSFALAAVATTALSFQANANLVSNGSFELGEFNNIDGDPRPEVMLVTPGMPNIFGWTIVGEQGVHWLDYGPANTTDGGRSLDLQGNNPPVLSSVSTTFSTQSGSSYRLSFDAFTGNVLNSATVSVGSLIGQAFTGGGPAPTFPFASHFAHYTYRFDATDSLSTLLFQVSSSDGFGPVIDNVVVTAEPGGPRAASEPDTYLLLGSAIALLCVSRMRRTS